MWLAWAGAQCIDRKSTARKASGGGIDRTGGGRREGEELDRSARWSARPGIPNRWEEGVRSGVEGGGKRAVGESWGGELGARS